MEKYVLESVVRCGLEESISAQLLVGELHRGLKTTNRTAPPSPHPLGLTFVLVVISLTQFSSQSHSLAVSFLNNRYIAKNINLYELSNEGTKLSTHAQANFARGELAAALRRGPYQVNVLLGGYDESKGEGSLYMMDYLGSLHKVKHGAQGYAQYFCSSIFDKEFDGVENCSEEQAVQIIEHCIKEIQTRFMLSQPNFIVKKVDKDGIAVLSFGEDPADN